MTPAGTKPDCLFCRVVAGEIPSTKVIETDDVLAFRDINPGAPQHVLVIPKQHIADSVADLDLGDAEVAQTWADLLAVAQRVAGSSPDSPMDGGWSPMWVKTAVRACFTFISTCWPEGDWPGLRAEHRLATVPRGPARSALLPACRQPASTDTACLRGSNH